MDDFSWFIGIAEGEACFGYNPKKNEPEFTVSMCDEDIVERLGKMLDHHYRTYQPVGVSVSGGKYKIQHRIQIRGRKAIKIMEKVLPYMGKRRQEKITEILEAYTPKTTYKTEGYIPKPKKPINIPLFAE